MDKKMTDNESRDFISTVHENFRAFKNSEKDYDAIENLDIKKSAIHSKDVTL